MNKDQKGCFVVFEGIDGAGKSKQVFELSRKLKNMKYDSLTTHEPHYESTIGKMIRRVLIKRIKISDPSFALLFAADRIEHTRNQILPILESNSIVICDRYIYSSLAYQTGGMDSELDMEWIEQINKFAIKPDIVFFLDITPEVGLSRLKEGQKRVVDDDFFDSIVKQTGIRNQYHRIFGLDLSAENPQKVIHTDVDGVNVLTIDATLPIDEIKEIIGEAIKPILTAKNIQKKAKKTNGNTNLMDFFVKRQE